MPDDPLHNAERSGNATVERSAADVNITRTLIGGNLSLQDNAGSGPARTELWLTEDTIAGNVRLRGNTLEEGILAVGATLIEDPGGAFPVGNAIGGNLQVDDNHVSGVAQLIGNDVAGKIEVTHLSST